MMKKRSALLLLLLLLVVNVIGLSMCAEHHGLFRKKRCKANCTFSAEKYTWFTVWKLPPDPPTPTFVHLQQSKQKHKRPVFFTTSDIWQFQNTSAQSVSTLSEHFHSYWDVFTLVAPTHAVRRKWRRQQGSSVSCYEISGRRCQNFPKKWRPKQVDYPPRVLFVFGPQGAKRAVSARPAFVLALRGPCHIYTQSCVPSALRGRQISL